MIDMTLSTLIGVYPPMKQLGRNNSFIGVSFTLNNLEKRSLFLPERRNCPQRPGRHHRWLRDPVENHPRDTP